MTLRFVDAFWGTDFLSTAGFDALHQRMKDAKTFTDDVISYIHQRAQIEETYARSLMKLAKSATGSTETGTMRAAWDEVQRETMELGNQHMMLAGRLGTEIERPVKEFRGYQRDLRKKVEEKLKATQKDKSNKYKDNDKARKNYETKCREAEKIEEELQKANLPPKELEKIKLKAKKAQAAHEAADAAYHETVKQLNEARLLWEKEMEACCELFQSMEEDRLDLLRRRLWLFTNLVSSNLVMCDQIHESIRQALEKCNPEQDLQEFLQQKKTGTERPSAIEYKAFHAAGLNDMSDVAAAVPATAPAAAPPIGPAPTSAPPTAGSPQIPPGHVLVIHDYQAQGELELSLKAGDLVRLVSKVDDTWWCGILDGRQAMFPANFVRQG